MKTIALAAALAATCVAATANAAAPSKMQLVPDASATPKTSYSDRLMLAQQTATRTAPAPATKPADRPHPVRDWSEMDTDKDHIISADEMERWMSFNRFPKPKN